MTPENWVFSEVKNRGVTLKFVSEKSGVGYNQLMNSQHYGRSLRADEFLSVCRALNLDIAAYYAQEGVAANA